VAMSPGFPNIPPKVYIRAKLKHSYFEIGDTVIEFKVTSFMNWQANNTVLELVNGIK